MLYSKKIYLNVIALLLVMTNFSCKTINMFFKEEYTKTNGVTYFEFKNGKMILQCEIENQKTSYPFLFDTGASTSILTDTTIIKDFEKLESSSFGKTILIDGESFKNKLVALDMKSDNLLDVKNKVVVVFHSPIKKKCDSTFRKGIIGVDIFKENNYTLNLDFEKNFIESLKREQSDNLIASSGYKQCDAKFKQGHIYLDLTINNQIVQCHFDTGNTAGIIIPKDQLEISNKNAIILTGEIFTTAKSITSSTEIYHENFNVSFADQELRALLSRSDMLNKPNVGMLFIKTYNWIIDYENKKLYFKKNANELISENKSWNDYYVRVKNDVLVVAVKNPNKNQYKIGDQIISVNNETITEDNICEMRNLLNTTADWSTIQVVVE